ncbi:MAG: CoA transferase [Desulfurellaceae bacterium]|nr:CoA transferase [Desulfurellaceae bacterium]
MPGPLAGYRVIDVTQMLSGPMSTMILGDQGADVIKVEPPQAGDLTRAFSSTGISPTFSMINRNKRSVAIDLKCERGVSLLKQLVAESDVFVQNFRPGAVERLGIDEPTLRRVKPELIYVSISGFGEVGPYTHKRVYDPVIQALSGLTDIQRDPVTGRPKMMRLVIPDKVTALTAAQAMTAALLARERTGTGQHVRLAMLDAVVSFLWPEGMAYHTFVRNGEAVSRPPDTRDLIFETADGYITAGAMSDKEWAGMVRALDKPEWLEDERFRTPAGRMKHADARLDMTAEVMKTRTSAEWLARLDAEQVPCAPALSRQDMLTNEQIVANRLIVESEHPHVGRTRMTRPAARFAETPAELRLPAPMLGEHTEQVLTEIGLSSAQIVDLRAGGVFG